MRDSRISFSSLGFALSPKALTLAPGLEASVSFDLYRRKKLEDGKPGKATG